MNRENQPLMIDIKKEVLEAENRIRAHIRETPLEFSPYLSDSGNCQVHLKLENIQLSGSFKLRGALNKFFSLTKEERDKGIITASSGNHGAAFAYLLKKFDGRGMIYLPEITARAKIEILRLYDANMKFHGDDCIKAELFAKEEARKKNQVFMSPYNDPKIIGGQGTVGIELERQLKKIDALFVPVGGGGLISGIAGYLKARDQRIEIIGCQPENSAVMYESVKAGEIVEMESKPTISDGSAGGIEKGTITLDICQKYVDGFTLVSEKEIKDAIRLVLEKHSLLIEGAAALSVAAFLKEKHRYINKNVVLIITGSKMSIETLKEVLYNGD